LEWKGPSRLCASRGEPVMNLPVPKGSSRLHLTHITPINMHMPSKLEAALLATQYNKLSCCVSIIITIIITRFPVLRTEYVEQHLYYCFPLFPILAFSLPVMCMPNSSKIISHVLIPAFQWSASSSTACHCTKHHLQRQPDIVHSSHMSQPSEAPISEQFAVIGT